MFPFRRPDEAPRRAVQVGVLVTTPAKRWLFPGGDAELALTLARMVLPADVLTGDDTRVEFGEMSGGVWVPSKLLKAAVSDATDQ